MLHWHRAASPADSADASPPLRRTGSVWVPGLPTVSAHTSANCPERHVKHRPRDARRFSRTTRSRATPTGARDAGRPRLTRAVRGEHLRRRVVRRDGLRRPRKRELSGPRPRGTPGAWAAVKLLPGERVGGPRGAVTRERRCCGAQGRPRRSRTPKDTERVALRALSTMHPGVLRRLGPAHEAEPQGRRGRGRRGHPSRGRHGRPLRRREGAAGAFKPCGAAPGAIGRSAAGGRHGARRECPGGVGAAREKSPRPGRRGPPREGTV